VERRRTIIELHSEWGVGKSFYADVRALRAVYEPLGCRVTLATMLRNPIAHQFSWFNWRAANQIPFCLWSPPHNALSRQICGFGLPFTPPDERLRAIPVGTALSALEHFDVVGLMEKFDESLVLLADAAGLQYYPYSKLAANNKPRHPKAAKLLHKSMLRDAGLSREEQLFHLERVRWSEETLRAAREYNQVSVDHTRHVKTADCNFFPCDKKLAEAGGQYSPAMCATDPPAMWLHRLLNRTSVDRALYAAAVRKLDAQLQAMALRGVPMAARLEELRDSVADVQQRRKEQLDKARGFCGLMLCGDQLRSCVGCLPNPVPGLEPCWPSWEDQFTPDERKLWCKRSWTYSGYDAEEIKAHTYPKVSPIPCWQTCWEVMVNSSRDPHGKAPTCLTDGAPDVKGGPVGKACEGREVHCTPGCAAAPTHASLALFWKDWQRLHHSAAQLQALNLGRPFENGG